MKFTHAFVVYHPCGKCLCGFSADAEFPLEADDADWFADALRKGRRLGYVPAEQARIGPCTCPTDSLGDRHG